MSKKISEMTKAERVLRWLKRFPDGKKFTEIQRYVVERIRGQDWDEREEKRVRNPYTGNHIVVGYRVRRWRGVWCDHLLDTWNQKGLLSTFCERTPEGRYRVVKPIKAPFYRKNS